MYLYRSAFVKYDNFNIFYGTLGEKMNLSSLMRTSCSVYYGLHNMVSAIRNCTCATILVAKLPEVEKLS